VACRNCSLAQTAASARQPVHGSSVLATPPAQYNAPASVTTTVLEHDVKPELGDLPPPAADGDQVEPASELVSTVRHEVD